jgi:hypothetical protein
MPAPPTPPKGDCVKCHRADTYLFGPPWQPGAVPDYCADCARDRAHATPFPGTGCDRCGAKGHTFRDASHRKDEYLCAKCHSDDGYAQGVRQLAPDIARQSAISTKQHSTSCSLADRGTLCRGEVKPRGGAFKGAMVCTHHAYPTRVRSE